MKWTPEITITLADELEVPVRLHVTGTPGRPERIAFERILTDLDPGI